MLAGWRLWVRQTPPLTHIVCCFYRCSLSKASLELWMGLELGRPTCFQPASKQFGRLGVGLGLPPTFLASIVNSETMGLLQHVFTCQTLRETAQGRRQIDPFGAPGFLTQWGQVSLMVGVRLSQEEGFLNWASSLYGRVFERQPTHLCMVCRRITMNQ